MDKLGYMETQVIARIRKNDFTCEFVHGSYTVCLTDTVHCSSTRQRDVLAEAMRSGTCGEGC